MLSPIFFGSQRLQSRLLDRKTEFISQYWMPVVLVFQGHWNHVLAQCHVREKEILKGETKFHKDNFYAGSLCELLPFVYFSEI
jgi:hypothetical protein